MFRWFLLGLALVLFACSLLTVAMVPDWVPWQAAMVTGEYGWWLAPVALGVGLIGGIFQGGRRWRGIATALFGLAAAGLLAKPLLQAWQLGRELPAKLARQFGPADAVRRPFAWEALRGEEPQPVPVKTLSFGDGLSLDFYAAMRSDGAPAPCVIVVHGGGWDAGRRDEIARFNHWLARRGYAVAAIEYRLAPKFLWPAQRDDTLAALAFLKAHATELRIDATRFVLFGRSAGGQIAMATAYTQPDPAVRGLIAFYTPADLVFGYEHSREDDRLHSPQLLRQFLGGPPTTARANYESGSGMFHVTKSTPPTLLVHGRLDTLVWYRHSERLDVRLTETGVPHVYLELPWATHAFEYNLRGPGGQLATFAVEWFLAAVTR